MNCKCSLTIRRVEIISVAGGKLFFFVKGEWHRAVSNILIASKQTFIEMMNDRHNAKLHAPLLKPVRNKYAALKQSLTDALSIGRQSYRVK